jgi:hypothetical protein
LSQHNPRYAYFTSTHPLLPGRESAVVKLTSTLTIFSNLNAGHSYPLAFRIAPTGNRFGGVL